MQAHVVVGALNEFLISRYCYSYMEYKNLDTHTSFFGP
jgi:hypothetical protein